jgi:DNA-3-methyladenine glycosylase II
MSLSTAAPFRLDLTIWALRRRGKNDIDRWDGSQYTRIIVLDSSPIRVTVTTQETVNIEPALIVTVHSEVGRGDQIREDVRLLLTRMLGLTVDLRPFYVLVNGNEHLRPLVEQFFGVRPPQFPTVFEALVNSIACQQVTLDLGILLLNRLSERFGMSLVNHGVTLHAFPRPADLAEAPEEAIRKLGFSHQKAQAIKRLATDVADHGLDLASLESMTNNEAVEYLTTIRGIGRWSAEYVLLRGLGRLDTFPGDDIGAQNNLQRLFHLDDRPDYEQISQLTSQWRPYGGMVYFHLLLEKLYTKGVL